jgi:hypothetical protein
LMFGRVLGPAARASAEIHTADGKPKTEMEAKYSGFFPLELAVGFSQRTDPRHVSPSIARGQSREVVNKAKEQNKP